MNLFLFFSFIIFGITGSFLYEYLTRKIGEKYFKKDALIVKGYRLHHSLYGLIGLMFSLFFFLNGRIEAFQVLIGLSIGILVQHTLTDGFRFVSKE